MVGSHKYLRKEGRKGERRKDEREGGRKRKKKERKRKEKKNPSDVSYENLRCDLINSGIHWIVVCARYVAKVDMYFNLQQP